MKIVIALNLYIGTNVFVYERRLFGTRPAGPMLSLFHTHIAYACESKISLKAQFFFFQPSEVRY